MSRATTFPHMTKHTRAATAFGAVCGNALASARLLRRCLHCKKSCISCLKACKDASKEKRREGRELCFVVFVMVALVSGMLAFFATVMA